MLDQIINFFKNDDKLQNRAHVLNSDILRPYDIRGVFGETLFTEDAYDIGLAFGSILIRRGLKTVCVGKDCRLSSNKLYEAVIRGLIRSGAHVISLCVCHTPLVYYASVKNNFDAGIMVTGSHNSSEYNGFKFVMERNPFFGDDIKSMQDIIERKDFTEQDGREIVMNDIVPNYISEITQDINIDPSIKVAWDIGNGATSNIVSAIIEKIPGYHHVLFAAMDGTFPNRGPDPTSEGALSQLSKFVVYNNFDIGVAFDSDGDRMCVVNSLGEVLDSDQTMQAFVCDFLRCNPGAKVIADIKSSNKLFDAIRANGGSAILEKTGHVFIKNKMKETGALLAAEMSGHFFFKDRWHGFDDGVYAALRAIEIASNSLDNPPGTFGAIEKGFITPEIRVPCEGVKKEQLIQRIISMVSADGYEFIDIDGVRVSMEIGWFLIRASNTEDKISIRIEANSAENLLFLKGIVRQYLLDEINNIDSFIPD